LSQPTPQHTGNGIRPLWYGSRTSLFSQTQ
jgi:hypothetical protein